MSSSTPHRLALPPLEAAIAMTSLLTILLQKGMVGRWTINKEQVELLTNLYENTRLVVLKGRQIGSSTLFCFFLLIVCLWNPGVPCCIVTDKSKKSAAFIAKIKAWYNQLRPFFKLPPLVPDNTFSIGFPNGSSIEALTAGAELNQDGQSTVARSGTYAVVLQSEKAFWRNAEAVEVALRPTLTSNAVVIDESTGSPGKLNPFRVAWEQAKNRLFFSMEKHEEYRLDDDTFTDADFERYKADFGFTIREAAAWFRRQLAEMKGDLIGALREYPILVRHAWAHRSGLFISHYTPTLVEIKGDMDVYPAPDRDDVVKEALIFGVDTGAGVGRDSSSVVAIGHRTGRAHWVWRSNTHSVPAFVKVIKGLVKDTRAAGRDVLATPTETNGIGRGVYDGLIDCPEANVREHHAEEGELWPRMQTLQQDVEGGQFPIGVTKEGAEREGHLQLECASCSVELRGLREVFVGHDDSLKAASFARVWRAKNPYRAPPAPIPQGQYDMKRSRGSNKKSKRFG